MYLKQEIIKVKYVRPSKLGNEHTYFRKKSVLVFRCDNCNGIFKRFKGAVDPKRVGNSYFHVCSECDSKRFAQRKGVERRTIWDRPVNSDIDISKL
jgi:hypothetical protein